MMTRPRALLLALTLFGLALRLPRLGMAPWGDETASWNFARHASLGEMLSFAVYDSTPPLFYALLQLTLPFTGDSPAALRLPALLCGLLTIPAIYWTTRQAGGDRRAALLAAGLGACSSALVYYAQEARAYALLALAGTLAVGLLLRCLAQRRLVDALLLGLALLLVCFSHRYGAFLAVAMALCGLLLRRPLVLAVAVLAGGALALFTWWQIQLGGFVFGTSGTPASLNTLYLLLSALCIGTPSFDTPPHPELLSYTYPLVNAALRFAGLLVAGTMLVAARMRSADQPMREGRLALWLCLAVPASLGLLAGSPLAPRPQWLMRGLLYLWPIAAVLLGLACAALPRRVGLTLASALAALNLVALWPYYTRYERFPDQAAFVQLAARTSSADMVVADPWYMAAFVSYYYRGPAPLVGHDTRTGWVDVAAMEREVATSPVPLNGPPSSTGDLYVFYRSQNLAWAEEILPQKNIYIYDSTTQQWQPYQQP